MTVMLLVFGAALMVLVITMVVNRRREGARVPISHAAPRRDGGIYAYSDYGSSSHSSSGGDCSDAGGGGDSGACGDGGGGGGGD